MAEQLRGGGSSLQGRVSTIDPDVQRARNVEAPEIPHLFARVVELFTGHRTGLIFTVVLVFAGAGLSILPPLLTKSAFDLGLFPVDAEGGISRPNLSILFEITLAMVGVYLVSGILDILQTWLTANIGSKVMSTLRVRLFSHLQKLGLEFFTRTKTGVIQSRLNNDVGGVSSVLANTVSSVLGNTVTVISAVVAMFLLNWQLSLIALVLTPLMVTAQRRVGRVRAKIAGQTQESLSEMSAITQEALSISGVHLSKSFNQQDAEVARYAVENANQIRLSVRQQMSGQWFLGLVHLLLAVIPVVIYLIAGYLIAGDLGFLSAGTIVAFTGVQTRLLFPFMGLLRVVLDLQTSRALFARIFEYLDLTPAITDMPNAVPVPLKQLGRVEFQDVEFRYPGAADDIRLTLDGLSFTVEPGQFVALVGPSGAGKTTVTHLIPRMYDASGGVVYFAGVDVRKLQGKSLIDHIGIVSQDTYLFHASIADNLRYAKTGASDVELEEAARKANIHDTIMSFPDGYQTIVGERGYRLSGGERQRIAVARVLLKDPAVLVLDEATSALDSVSERVVQIALDSASRGRTTIAVAHRLSTVRHADLICVVVDGRIIERGSHDDLLQAGGVYFSLFAAQQGIA